MRIIMFGDSITDMNHSQELNTYSSYGFGYPMIVYSKMCETNPLKYEVINKGVSGNRIVDLYARIKIDVWNLKPDVLSILIGVNEVWHELSIKNGTELDRFENIYRLIIEETKQRLPNVKIMLLEPFYLQGVAVEHLGSDGFKTVYDYAKCVKRLAKDYNLTFVPLQEKLTEAANKYGNEFVLYDGVHPNVGGATIIANEWIKAFNKI